ncbi:MAG: type II toxin-antitoxin system PemK/MazF family toxin [Flavobacteriales bacterium]|jgi:mRNA interferase MazF
MIKQFDIWLANLNPGKGTEMGKVRPVVVVQTDLLNNLLSSTIICPVTSQVNREMNILRIYIGKRYLEKESAILVDQMRAIDNRRLLQRLGKLQPVQIDSLKDSLRTILEV